MTRGFRGATTISENNATEIMEETRKLVLEMVQQNNIKPNAISHVFFSVTNDINAAFPAKVARELPGWTHVPVMCMKEIEVPNRLKLSRRVMLVAKTTIQQYQDLHIYLKEEIKLLEQLISEENE